MKNTLNEQILAKCQDKVARNHEYADWLQIDMTDTSQSERDEIKANLWPEVAAMSTEILSEFYHYLFSRHIFCLSGVWFDAKANKDMDITEEELYQEFEKQRG